MNISTLLDEIKVALAAGVSNVDVYDTVPGRINPPAAILSLGQGRYHDTFDGSMTVEVLVTLLASRADERAGQDKLHSFLLPTAVVAAIEDGTYTQNVDVVVVSWESPASVEVGGTPYYTVGFRVECID